MSPHRNVVALLAEGVDRNTPYNISRMMSELVALLAEGVDRNCIRLMSFSRRISSPSSRRAWIEIFLFHAVYCGSTGSPSSRRAWIEISSPSSSDITPRVALLAEGVDRNKEWQRRQKELKESPSSRRAWIEIENRK